MGNIVKLQNAGESVTWTIAKAETTAGNFGPQVKFESTNGEVLYLPEDSATRQLSRIPLEIAECVGETLVISRDPNPKPGAKPYWGIRLAGATDKAPTSKRLPPPEKASGPSIGKMPFDDFPDEDYGRSVQSPDGADPYLEPPRAPTPHRVPTGEEGFERFSRAVDSVVKGKEAEYLALFDRVAQAHAAAAKKYGFPLDASAIQATTFSIFKT